MILKLQNIDVDCIIGECPDERVRLQQLRVDVELTVNAVAAKTDRLEDTVDYAVLTEAIRQTLVAAQCRMIERAAKIVAEVCLKAEKVSRVKVQVTKSGAIPHLEAASVIYEETR